MIRILDGNTFVVCDERGDIEASPTEPTGLFSFDTRFLSTLGPDDQRPAAQPAVGRRPAVLRVALLPRPRDRHGLHRRQAVGHPSARRRRRLPRGADDPQPSRRAGRPRRSGSTPAATSPTCSRSRTRSRSSARYATAVEDGRLRLGYERETFRRETVISASAPASVDEHGLTFTVRIEPHGSWTTDLDVVTSDRGPGRDVRRVRSTSAAASRRARTWSAAWSAGSPTRRGSRCDWEPLTVDLPAQPGRPRRPAVLAARRRRQEPAGRRPAVVHDDVRPRQHLHQPPVAAVHARARRRRRCGRSATGRAAGVDDFRDEDPGRILHEMRYGEMAAFEERPHSPYYGSVDATPLYVVLLDEYERWTGDRKLVRELEYEARAALNWIDEYADLHGQRLHLVQAPQRADRPREPVLEGLVELDRVQRRPAAGLPARDLRAPGLRLRREDPRRPAGPARLEGPGVRRPARARGRRPQAALQPRLLDPGRRVLRARARRRRQPGRLARLEHRPPAVERHRRRIARPRPSSAT